MKIIKKTFPRGEMYPVENLAGDNTPIFFDIETTGLNHRSCFIYLIGVLKINKDNLEFVQWFSEGVQDEEEVLDSFLSYLPEKPYLITFNGRGFDIPFLTKKCKEYNKPCYLSQMSNNDLYRSFEPLKKYFDMDSRKLVAYEKLIGLNREDQFNGKDLIDVYKEYIGYRKFDPEKSEELYKFLLLHNEEDILDMVPVLSLFNYLDLLDGRLDLKIAGEITNPDGTKSVVVKATAEVTFPVTSTKYIATLPSFPLIMITTAGKTATITLPIVNGSFKYFFDNYKDYYYLPDEDKAIHKSLADSVDKAHRVLAKRDTAFAEINGTFVAVATDCIKGSLKRSYSDPYAFIKPEALEDNLSLILKGIK